MSAEVSAVERRTVLAVAVLAAFIAFLDGSIVGVALPVIERELGGGVALQQWIVDAYLLSLGALILLAGSLSDLFGRVRVLRAGLIGFGIASVLCALAPTGPVLVIARALQGIAGALLVPSALALITSRIRGPQQSAAIGQWTAWTSVANVIGPLLGGVLADQVGWRWIFGVNVVPIAITLVLLGRLGADPVPVERPRLDIVGALLAALGLFGAVFGLIEGARLGFGDPVVWVPLVVGVLLLVAFVVWQRRHPHPLVPLDVFASRNFSWGNAATFLIYGALSFGTFAVPIFVQEAGGFTALQSGLLVVPVTLVLIVLSAPIGRWSGRVGQRWFMTVGPIIAGIGFLTMLTAREPVDPIAQVLPGMLIFGVGLAVTVAPLTSAILGALPAERSGIASAVNNAVSRVGGLIAIALAGVVIGEHVDVAGLHRAVAFTGVLLILGGIVSAIGIRDRR